MERIQLHFRNLTARLLTVLLAGLVSQAARSEPAPAPARVPGIGPFPITAIMEKDLLSDEIFMKSVWGLKLEDIKQSTDRIVVSTTGAVFDFDLSESLLTCRQRIGRAGTSLELQFEGVSLNGLTVTTRDTGAAILDAPGLRIKINGDSLLMLRAAAAVNLSGRVAWSPEVTYPADQSQLLLDPFGALGFYPIRGKIEAHPGPDPARQQYDLEPDAELWIAVGPPREYDWNASFHDRLIWQGSWQKPELAVPADNAIMKWSDFGTILWLQSENMMWQSWHEGFEPRLPAEFARVIATAHRLKTRVIAYASPFYFTKGVAGEHTNTGANTGLYLEAVAKLLRDYPDLDGIYFDGVYPGSVEDTYRMCRAARALIGDDRILMIHCTHNAPGGKWGQWSYNPAADTYANFILRGESFGFVGSQWLRYFVSGYNISNAIGVVCNNAGHWIPSKQQAAMTLRANCRLTYMPFEPAEFPDGNVYAVNLPPLEVEERIVQALQDWYWPRLNPSYRIWFEGVNAASAFALPPPAPAPPPHPCPDLTRHDLTQAKSARLVFDSFGVDTPEYHSFAFLNDTALGELPPSTGDVWTAASSVPLPAAAIAALGAGNALRITNPDRDCFKLRNLYIEIDLADGRRASSNLLDTTACSDQGWAHLEGAAVPIGEDLTFSVPIPLTAP